MKAKLLIENPFMKDPARRKASIERSVRTSGGVEGIKHSGSKITTEKEAGEQKRTK